MLTRPENTHSRNSALNDAAVQTDFAPHGGKTQPAKTDNAPETTGSGSRNACYPRFNKGDAFMTMKEVMVLTGTSDKFIYAQIQKGLFPKPLKFGRASRWILSEVYEYINGRATSGSSPKT
ncbi:MULTISPECIES: helix-turn-helix transcriptional regulator [Enterobacteriaceae]|uniref:helix-turn-helix transcriptional regulator n=1 Tax=Enterobacteriaceae TaxID=543 RepID=UPI002A368894|nr:MULTISPECIES: AlpA family phage regulatory protein [Enterobacteriaceae]